MQLDPVPWSTSKIGQYIRHTTALTRSIVCRSAPETIVCTTFQFARIINRSNCHKVHRQTGPCGEETIVKACFIPSNETRYHENFRLWEEIFCKGKSDTTRGLDGGFTLLRTLPITYLESLFLSAYVKGNENSGYQIGYFTVAETIKYPIFFFLFSVPWARRPRRQDTHMVHSGYSNEHALCEHHEVMLFSDWSVQTRADKAV